MKSEWNMYRVLEEIVDHGNSHMAAMSAQMYNGGETSRLNEDSRLIKKQQGVNIRMAVVRAM